MRGWQPSNTTLPVGTSRPIVNTGYNCDAMGRFPCTSWPHVPSVTTLPLSFTTLPASLTSVCGKTPEQYGERLLEDIGERPDYYYQHREVPRLEDELVLFQAELWQQADLVRKSGNRRYWFGNISKLTCGYCQFADLCLNGITITPDSLAVSGFEYLEEVHPELAEKEAS